jgi:prephenate dehydrogenase
LFGFAASGFRDFTRIAASSPEMWRDIALANRDALLTELAHYQIQLQHLQTALIHADAAYLEAVFRRAQAARAPWSAA